MGFAEQCPRCGSALSPAKVCDQHPQLGRLLGASSADYEAFLAHLEVSAPMPSWLPWPMPSGWQIYDFGAVPGRACYVTVGGMSERDGQVALSVVVEEPGIGLGARISGSTHDDPEPSLMAEAPTTRIKIEGAGSVPLWMALDTTDHRHPMDSSALVGELQGRWLWLIFGPSAAAMLISELRGLRDANALGAELAALNFATVPRAW